MLSLVFLLFYDCLLTLGVSKCVLPQRFPLVLQVVGWHANMEMKCQTNTNEQVYSVLDGVILTITNIRDYGDIIILNHGAGYYTVYSNLKNITVYEGQYVDTYTHLAEVAQGTNSNYSNKNIFNFQIWLNQEKLDPEKWIKK